MISFVSIFLGLMVGAHDVELAPAGDVATVEVRLDGELAAQLDGPPWVARVDFGDEPAPQRLEAVALDWDDREVGRAGQWINLPRPPAEVRISIESRAEGGAAVARLSWESVAGERPTAVSVAFDGESLESADPAVWELPPHDPEAPHFLRAEVEFGPNVVASAERLFGGGFADRVAAAATAVPVAAAKGGKLRPADVAGRLAGGDGPLRVLAVEKGPIEIALVVAREASAVLAEMGRRAPTRVSELVGPASAQPSMPEHTVRPVAAWRAQLLWPVPYRRAGAQLDYDLFPHSQRFAADEAPLDRLLTGVEPPAVDGAQRLADAVAIAGLAAATGNRRRAVVLVLGEAPADASEIAPGAARRFLERLRVPLYVWRVAGEEDGGGWGKAEDAGSASKLERLAARLLRALDRQWIVWVEGTPLPQEVELTPGERRLELAGSAR